MEHKASLFIGTIAGLLVTVVLLGTLHYPNLFKEGSFEGVGSFMSKSDFVSSDPLKPINVSTSTNPETLLVKDILANASTTEVIQNSSTTVVQSPATQVVEQNTQQQATKVPVVSEKAVTKKSGPVLANFVKGVVQLECYGANDTDAYGGGTGFSVYLDDGRHAIMTNAHVIRAYDGSFGGCLVYFPMDDGIPYESVYIANLATFYDDVVVNLDGIEYGGSSYKNGGLDFAFLELTEPYVHEDGTTYPPVEGAKFPNLRAESEKTCTYAENELGDKIYALGYPGVGGNSMTVTEGIIAGFGFDRPYSQQISSYDGYEYIKTSAKISHGNSGGIAVRAHDGCLLGITSIGLGGGRDEYVAGILHFPFIQKFMDAMNANKIVAEFSDPNTYVGETPFTVPLYEGVRWEKMKNARKTFLEEDDRLLTFETLCSQYENEQCASSLRSFTVPRGDRDVLYKTKTTYETTSQDWVAISNDIHFFQISALASLGFTQEEPLYLPEYKAYIIPDTLDLTTEDVYGDVVFRAARRIGDQVQFAALHMHTIVTRLQNCPDNSKKCRILVEEKASLFLSDLVPIQKLLSFEERGYGIFTRIKDSYASVVRAVINYNN